MRSRLLKKKPNSVQVRSFLVWVFHKARADFWAEALESDGPPIRWTDRLAPHNQRDLGRAMVATWHDQGLPIFTQAEKILAVEEPFRVELVHSDGRVLRTPLAGIIDAIILRADGTVVVVDHKTAKQAYRATYVDHLWIHAPDETAPFLQGRVGGWRGGRVTKLKVSPESRRKGVVVVSG